MRHAEILLELHWFSCINCTKSLHGDYLSMCGAKRLMVHVVIGFGTAARDMLSKVHVKAGSLGSRSRSCHGTVPETMVEPP
jgi:hypothetical protein